MLVSLEALVIDLHGDAIGKSVALLDTRRPFVRGRWHTSCAQLASGPLTSPRVQLVAEVAVVHVGAGRGRGYPDA